MQRSILANVVIRIVASAAIATQCHASEATAATLSCVPSDGCGCAIVLDGETCPAGSSHFFHALNDGAALRFMKGHELISAASLRPESNTFSPAAGASWTERYRHEGGKAEISYTPSRQTCNKPDAGHCEYFDVRARIVISAPGDTRSYSGTGTCGC